MTAWIEICSVEDIPRLGARRVELPGEADTVALFRTGADEIFALRDRCPHKNGPLSQGLVHGKCVTCPLHGLVMNLESGDAVPPDTGSASAYKVRVEQNRVWILMSPAAAGVE